MTWIDEILGRCPQPVMINDSKTPSGIAHVGSLRGVLMHDALFREARERGLQARFTYGCDDMDPVDEIPHGTGQYFREHLGKPLCRAPAPPGLPGDSMAQVYFDEFTSTFGPLGVDAEFYYMSEVYRSGPARRHDRRVPARRGEGSGDLPSPDRIGPTRGMAAVPACV